MKHLSVILVLFLIFSSLAVFLYNNFRLSAQTPGNSKLQKWSGLGMGLFTQSGNNPGYFKNNVDYLLANGFNDLRIDIPDYQNIPALERSKRILPEIIEKGARVVWGVSSNSLNNPAHTITSQNWPLFRQAILEAAAWAQVNGVYEFQLGNEEELHVDGTTITKMEILNNLKSVAAEVKNIFTNGKISYSFSQSALQDWVKAGKGEIDILALNVYIGGEGNYRSTKWKSDITKLVNTFGPDSSYISEFAPSYSSLENYSKDEREQAKAVTEMITFIKQSGIKRAYFFCWNDARFGVVKRGNTYRLLWEKSLLNSDL